MLYKTEPQVLNQVQDSVVCYSLRKLKAGVTNCIRVRRSSDNAELDIGFVGNELDTSSLLAFVGANNGFVVTWYDQSGNDNHVTQAVAGNQPQIVDTGVILTDTNGNYAIKGISANDTILVAPYNASFDISTNLTINAVHDPVTTGGGGLGRIVSKNDTSDYALYLGGSNLMRMSATTASVNQAYALNTVNLNSVIVTGNSTADFYYQGNSVGLDNSIQATATGNNTLCLFNRATGSRGYDGYISEVVIFNKPISDSERIRLESNQKREYKIA
jgi:hypothetical protein